MSTGRGYLLPEGEAYTDDLACTIVFYPDKEEYRRALLGSLAYLSKWLAWERDTEKRGKDAARAWREANELTLECLQMNVCTQIIDLLTEIRDNQCVCSGGNTENTTYNQNIVVVNNITPWVGQAPSTWAGEAVSDWDEWAEYVCGAGNSYVDDLLETVDRFSVLAGIGGLTLDFIAHVYSLLNWRYILDIIPVNWDLVFSIVDAIGEGLLAIDWVSVKSSIELARDDIVCALINGTDLGAAVQSAVNNTVLWDWFFSHLDYENTTAIIYSGEVTDIGYIPVIQSDACNCGDAFTCENSLMSDCSFESASWDHGWTATPDALSAGTTFELDAYHGDWSLRLGGGAGWPTRYVYQEFTAPSTGILWFSWWGHYIAGTYSTGIKLQRYTGGQWVDVWDRAVSNHVGYWENQTQLASVTQGELYRIQIYNGSYHRVDYITSWYQ